jgi:hypothetical protein
MKKLSSIALISAALFSSIAMAGTQCTDDSKDKWQDQSAFQAKLVEQGYTIKKFKVTSGHCYEIYGHNDKGQKVEIYFNLVSGDKVKEEIDD